MARRSGADVDREKEKKPKPGKDATAGVEGDIAGSQWEAVRFNLGARRPTRRLIINMEACERGGRIGAAAGS